MGCRQQNLQLPILKNVNHNSCAGRKRDPNQCFFFELSPLYYISSAVGRSCPKRQTSRCSPRSVLEVVAEIQVLSSSAEHAGESQNVRLPDHQNHHHEATKVSTESCKSKKDSETTRAGTRHTVAKREGTVANFPRGEARPARAPWWSASGNLSARTADARPAQSTPWWSASGGAPSNSQHNLQLFY